MLKKSKKIVSLLIAVVICFSLPMSVLATTNTKTNSVSSLSVSAQEETKVTLDDVQFIGITSGIIPMVASENDTTPIFQNTTIYINHLDIHNGVNISGSISTLEGNIGFHFIGDLFVSRKQDQGIEAYVGQIVDTENEFDINYFEIKNDTSMDLLKYSESLLDKRTLSFDLERDGIKYYFELDLDELGITFDASNITQLAPENIDFYEIYVDKDSSVAPCTIPYDEDIFHIVQPLSTYSYLKVGELWYHKQVVNGWYGSSTFEYYGMGGTEGNIVDVGKSGSSNWTSALKFYGHVRKDGEIITNQTNYFNIKAGVQSVNGVPTKSADKIEFRMYTGANTQFTSGRFNGTCKINGSDKTYNTAKLDLVVSALGYVNPTFGAATKVATYGLKIFQSIFTATNYTLGSEFISSDTRSNKFIVGNQFDYSVSLDKNEHEIIFSGLVSTVSSSQSPNASTDAVVQWSFNMCNGNNILKSETVTANVNYISNMS